MMVLYAHKIALADVLPYPDQQDHATKHLCNFCQVYYKSDVFSK